MNAKRHPVRRAVILVIAIVALGALAKRFTPDFSNIDWDEKLAAMPDNAPPKWMFRNITAIRENTDRIIELLDDGAPEAASAPDAIGGGA